MNQVEEILADTKTRSTDARSVSWPRFAPVGREYLAFVLPDARRREAKILLRRRLADRFQNGC